tara:strand:+ start:124 stop:1332 length:1209 start_codon:yes stop_codon:yes gene_type:complete
MNKTKKNKRRCNYEKTMHTLDVCHEKKLEDFNKNYNGLNKLQKELKTIRKNIKKLQLHNTDNYSDSSSDDNIDTSEIRNKLHEYKMKEKSIIQKINELTNKKEEIDYLTQTSDILFNYYDSIENNNEPNNNPNVKKIIDFFNPNKIDEETPKKCSNDDNQDRSELLESYLSTTDKNYINNHLEKLEDKCNFCNSTNINELLNDGILYCTECNTIEFIQTDNERPSYKDPPKEISYFSYNRINHFNEWINQVQGRECTEIPEEVYDKIYLELKKEKIENMATLNYDKIKTILKKIKVNKYYEHIPYILNRITGKTNPQLTPDLEEKLRNMFKEIQVPFLKHSPSNRKNFLSYSYVLHKFLELLGEDEFLQYFPLLKSREKLHQQEQVWKKICEELGWQFIRSI